MNIAFTSDLWIVLLIMLVGGILGGIVNFYFVPAPTDQPQSLGRCVILGVGASALVPIFLFITQSKVLDKLFAPVSANLSDSDKAIDTLFFISLCFLAGISSTRFITSVSDQMITQLKEDIKDTNKTVKENSEKIDKTQQVVEETKATAVDTEKKTAENKATLQALKEVQKARSLSNPSNDLSVQPEATRGLSPANSDDPQKGRWGGKNTNNSYQLSATVTAIDSDNDFFRVVLQVLYIGPDPAPADDVVTFHLHNTFTPSVRQAPFQDKKASLELYAWGAFTVGAVTSNGTKLELDLSDPTLVPDAPQTFRDR
ncbi:YEATS-associated helix-containing protein [Spirosoma sp. KNUC1025]|uniref:YEATS-associated helix-containing protein n=1 Tax=Spirosoma sp. KNUC1025 TaxID=2894082 RepID=UPI00386A17DB|nr:hypothetical protein LN737_17785 [Spirosoma sp. KNUC1025]